MSDRIGVALAAGGERLVGWHTGVLAGLADAGLDLRGARAVVGTSAGSLVAARLAAGQDVRAAADRATRAPQLDQPAPDAVPAADRFGHLARALAAAPGATDVERRRALGRLAIERSPGGAEEHVALLRRRLASAAEPDAPLVWPDALRIVAVDALTGERVVLDAAAEVPLERAVAASRGVPLLRAPVELDGRPHVDGALASATSADVLARVPGLRFAIVVTGSPEDAAPGTVDALWNAALDRELDALGAAGIDALVVRADDAARAAMGPNPMSGATAHLAVAHGRRQGRALAGRLALV